MKQSLIAIMLLVLTGCANHATFKEPGTYTTVNDKFTGQTMKYSIAYSQPEPGIFTGGEQQPLKPVSDTNLSVVSTRSLQNINEIVERHLPAGVTTLANENAADFQFDVEITAYEKQGPTFWDFEFLKSLGVGLVTLGLGPDYWDVIADFDVKYALKDSKNNLLIAREYSIEEKADHQASPFDTNEPLLRSSQKMFEQQLALTLNDFFEAADLKFIQEKGQ